MTATPAAIEPGPGAALTGRDRGAYGDHFFRWLALAAGLVVLAILALIAFSTTKEAWPALSHAKQHFVTSDKWVPNDVDGPGPAKPSFGALAFIYGTAVASAISLVLAVPLCLGLALFITELAPRWLRGPVVTLLDLLAAVPSVVFGLWGIAVLAPNIVGFYKWLHGITKPIPLLRPWIAGSQRTDTPRIRPWTSTSAPPQFASVIPASVSTNTKIQFRRGACGPPGPGTPMIRVLTRVIFMALVSAESEQSGRTQAIRRRRSTPVRPPPRKEFVSRSRGHSDSRSHW